MGCLIISGTRIFSAEIFGSISHGDSLNNLAILTSFAIRAGTLTHVPNVRPVTGLPPVQRLQPRPSDCWPMRKCLWRLWVGSQLFFFWRPAKYASWILLVCQFFEVQMPLLSEPPFRSVGRGYQSHHQLGSLAISNAGEPTTSTTSTSVHLLRDEESLMNTVQARIAEVARLGIGTV